MTLTTTQSRIRPRLSRTIGLAALVLAALLLAGCDQTGQMADQPRYDPYQESSLFADGRSARPIVEGAVPVSAGDQSPNDPALTGAGENGDPVKEIPVTVDQALLAKGQERYNIYCIVCHGPSGEGNGRVVGFGFPKPPSLLEADAKALSSGEIFGIIRDGRGKMFPYGYRVKAGERWAIVAYLRALQLKNGPVNLSELTPDQLNQLGK